jgi:hypothetical protein
MHTPKRPVAIVGGLMILGLGALMLLDRTGTVTFHAWRSLGPIFLIVLGATMIFEKSGVWYSERHQDDEGRERMRVRRRGSPLTGLWLIGVGGWLMVSQTHAWGLDYHNSWPILVILMGILMVLRGLR